MTTAVCLSSSDIAIFKRDGFLVLPQFYDIKRDIEPIQREIYFLIKQVAQHYQIKIKQAPFTPERFDMGYLDIVQQNRTAASVIYDAVKHIPAFVRLTACLANEQISRELRQCAHVGVSYGGFGIRIDNPHEERFRAPYHQDYPAQMRSMSGLVLWSPLVPIDQEMGPVVFCKGSHSRGLAPIHLSDAKNPEKTGAYGLRLVNEEEIVARYEQIAPLSVPGDLVIIDYLTIHASGQNKSTRSRWSMQMRYFSFDEADGQQMNWIGGQAALQAFQKYHQNAIHPLPATGT